MSCRSNALALAACVLAWSSDAGAQTFTNVTMESGAAALRSMRPSGWWLSGFQLVDLDGDGDLDLSLGAHGGGNGMAAENDGKGHFTALPDAPWSASEFHVVIDLDEDGKLDMVTTEGDGGGRWWINQSTPGAINFRKSMLSDAQSRYQSLIDIDRDGKVDWLAMANVGSIAQPGLRIYLGDGKGGLAMPKTITLGGEAAPLALDFDGDGDIDILMQAGNYPNSPVIAEHTRAYRNDGKMAFTDVTQEVGLDVPGLSVLGQGDVDGDGDTDLIGIENRKFPMVIYLNDQGRFTKKANAVSGPTTGGASQGNAGLAVLTDLDNDGIGDILIAGVSWFHVLRGTGGGSFTFMNQTWGGIVSGGQLPDSGFAFGDIDGDGDLDLIGYDYAGNVKSLNVYQNDLPRQSWLKVRPVGLAGNKAATGAKIRVYAAGTEQLLWYEEVVNRAKQVLPSYYAFSETERHFGLGSHATVDVAVLFYPSNKLVRKDGVGANTTVRISEDGSGVIIAPDAGSTEASEAGSPGADGAGPSAPMEAGFVGSDIDATDAPVRPPSSGVDHAAGCQCHADASKHRSDMAPLIALTGWALAASRRRRRWLCPSIALAAACSSGAAKPEGGAGLVHPVASAGRPVDAGMEAFGPAGMAGGGSGGAPLADAAAQPEVGPPIDVPPEVDAGALLSRVAFGSCNELTKSQGFWSTIVNHQPQVFLFLGDNAYLDYGDTYAELGAVPGFQQLLEIARPVAIWDDHDYGQDNGGAAFSGKAASKTRFIDFWGPLGAIPAESPRRTREGNYDSAVMGPVGRQIQFIMLDVRYFKGVAPAGTVLGAAQWQWLGDELRRPAELRIIMSGIAAVGSSASSDAWAEFPEEQQHLYDVIKGSQAKGVVIVSGDKHYAEISKRDVGLGYPLYDFTASALNASNSYAPQANLYRDTPTAATQAHNFGLLTIDWTTVDRPMSFQILDAETGALLMSKDVTLAALGKP